MHPLGEVVLGYGSAVADPGICFIIGGEERGKKGGGMCLWCSSSLHIYYENEVYFFCE